MKLLILSSLPLYILLYNLFVSILPYRIRIVSACPYISSPQHRFYFWMIQEYLFRSNAFYCRYYLPYIIRWNTLHQKMNMVFVRTNLHKNNFVPLCNLKTYLFQCCDDLTAKYFSSVFRRAYYMVQQQSFVMTFKYMFTHIINLHILPRPRGSGNSID